jgi:hypothetical protein
MDSIPWSPAYSSQQNTYQQTFGMESISSVQPFSAYDEFNRKDIEHSMYFLNLVFLFY